MFGETIRLEPHGPYFFIDRTKCTSLFIKNAVLLFLSATLEKASIGAVRTSRHRLPLLVSYHDAGT